MNFPENLKRLRKARKLSQTQLAIILGISQRTVSHYEKGGAEPSLSCLCEMANLLHVSTDELLGYSKQQDEIY